MINDFLSSGGGENSDKDSTETRYGHNNMRITSPVGVLGTLRVTHTMRQFQIKYRHGHENCIIQSQNTRPDNTD